jgi:POT family proton-dependent oligopeptide transporter
MIVIAPLVKKLMHLDTRKDDDHTLAGERALGEPAAAGIHIEDERR